MGIWHQTFCSLVGSLILPVSLLGANQHRNVPEVSGEGGRSRQDCTISRPRNPLAGARSLRGAGGEEEAGAGVDRLLPVVEGEVVAARVFLAARLAR